MFKKLGEFFNALVAVRANELAASPLHFTEKNTMKPEDKNINKSTVMNRVETV